MKRFLKFLSKLLGLSGFGFIMGAIMSGNIKNGEDIIVFAIFGFCLLILSALIMMICAIFLSIDSPQNFNHITFPDS